MSQSATSSESPTIPPDQFIWKAQTTAQCSPITMQVLQMSEYISEGLNNPKLIALTTSANSRTIQRNSFLPTMAKEDNMHYNWWIVLTRPQFEQYSKSEVWRGAYVDLVGQCGTIAHHLLLLTGGGHFKAGSIRSTYNGTTLSDIHIKTLLGPTIGTWELTKWSMADNGNGTLWLDHCNCHMDDNIHTIGPLLL
eukprot:5666760-Amphidinium_carterae.1